MESRGRLMVKKVKELERGKRKTQTNDFYNPLIKKPHFDENIVNIENDQGFANKQSKENFTSENRTVEDYNVNKEEEKKIFIKEKKYCVEGGIKVDGDTLSKINEEECRKQMEIDKECRKQTDGKEKGDNKEHEAECKKIEEQKLENNDGKHFINENVVPDSRIATNSIVFMDTVRNETNNQILTVASEMIFENEQNSDKQGNKTIVAKERKELSASPPGCSFWQKVQGSNMKLRLRKVEVRKEKTESKSNSGQYTTSEADDTDEDPTYELPKLNVVKANDLLADLTSDEEPTGSDAKQKRNRRKKADPSKWKRNVAKEKRNKGETYINSNLKNPTVVEARSMQPPCNEKCKLKCTEKFLEETRKLIFEKYWELGNLYKQREFIARMVSEVKPQYRYQRDGSNRGFNHAFHFCIEDKKIRVCKKFFKSTLGINDRNIRTVIKKSKDGFVELDQRGKHENHDRVDPVVKQEIREFISKIPRVESHYIRQQSSREYVEGGKTKASLYKDYKDHCLERNIPVGDETMFNRIFNNDFNISFFVPKKDQCEVCTANNNCEEKDKEKFNEVYRTHLEEKELSRNEKREDKNLAERNKNIVVGVFDLQAVLPAPKGEVSLFYYKSKLNSYNLTISELNLKNVQCYFWHEGEGNRGAIEIATCVFKFLKNTTENINDENLEIILYSDNCGGQQKNSFLFGMYLYAVQTLKLKSITHKFLIKGHTQNEGDNIHSVIEKSVKRALRSGPIYTPTEYIRIIRSAKKTGEPYKVIEMSHSDFLDWKKVTKQIGSNFTYYTNDAQDQRNNTQDNTESKRMTPYTEKNIEKENDTKKKDNTIAIADIKIVKMLKNEPRVMFAKTSYKQREFLRINVDGTKPIKPIRIQTPDETFKKETTMSKNQLKRKSKNCKNTPKDFKNIDCPPAYPCKLVVGERKKLDILSLLKSNHIPKFYEPYYKAIFD